MIMRKFKDNLTDQKGSGLIEVLIAILIFTIGAMALSQLQGRLTRSSADANVRTVATNIAEETIESLRGFSLLATDPSGLLPAYADITDGATSTVARGNTSYNVTTAVSDWYYSTANQTFMDSASYFALSPTPTDVFSDYKLVNVTVSWGDTQPWLVDGNSSFSGATSVTLSSVISSMTTGGGSKVATQTNSVPFVTIVDYTPGQNPDIVALDLGNGIFRESLTPEPEVFRVNELVETHFDVLTYANDNGDTQLVRAEEFISVTCECTLEAPPGTPENAGRRPTLWEGDEYSEAPLVDKPYGTPSLAATQQSRYCDTCCRDHHDGGSHPDDAEPASTLYDPFPKSSRAYWSSGPFAGDHVHYFPDSNGTLVPVDGSAGNDTYLESCALVRKDGFVRVIQDINQRGVNAFSEEFLDETAEVGVYSNYVTGAVSSYVDAVYPGYQLSQPTLTPPSTGQTPGDLWPDYTNLTTLSPTRNLSNRGIYIGYLSNDLQYVIDCVQGVIPAGGCESGNVKLDKTGSTNILELAPFFEVQLTLLSRWNEAPVNNPVDTTNETVQSGNLHSRGVASPGGRLGMSLVSAKGHPGNIGLTDTDPIELNFTTTSADINVESMVGSGTNDPNLTYINGTITSSIGGNLNVSSVMVTASDAQCDRTVDGFTCAITGALPSITVSGYGKNTPTDVIDRVACSPGLSKTSESFVDVSPSATFSLLGTDGAILYNINIKKGTGC